MRRRFTRNLIVTSLVLVTTLSLMIAPTAVGCGAGDSNKVISKLKALRNEILELPENAFRKPCLASIYRRALANKIGFVICMVEVGAYQGAVNQLEKDVKNVIEHRLTEEYAKKLIQKIDEIINLLKKLKPPHSRFPNFAVTAFPKSLTLEQGGSNSSTIIVISLNGFNKPVDLTAITSPPMPGVFLTLNPPRVTPPKNDYATSTLTVEAAEEAEVGTYTITVTATSGILKHSVEIPLEILQATPPKPVFNFDIIAYPSSLNVQQGGSNASIITITSLSDSSQPVDLAVTSESMSGVTTNLNPSKVIPPPNKSAISIMTIDVATTAPIGSYTITVTGTNGTLIRSTNISLEVIAPPTPPVPDFSIATSPPSLTVQQGSLNTSTIIVVSLKGFNGSVNLHVTSQPIPSVRLTLSQSTVTLSPDDFATSTLTVEVNATALPNENMLIVTGTNGALEHSVKIPLKIIAEATPPIIHNVLRVPERPNYNDTVTVLAFVADVGSGIKDVVLSYSGGAAWTNVTMTLKDGLYRASIPAFSYNTTVEYRIYAYDNASNAAVSNLYSYKVIDLYPPLLRIDKPAQGSYLSGTVAITVFMKDQNSGGESGFGGAELSINGTVVKMWNPPVPLEPVTYDWNTATFGPDGVYNVKLTVQDKAGNVVEKSLTVVVDNTFPSAVINAPVNGSYLRLSVLIKVTGSDTNFDKMEVRMDDELVKTSTTSGSEVLEWNTRNYDDGVHGVTLTVYDKAGNRKQTFVNSTVDNTPSSIGVPSWAPKEPDANVDIIVNVTVTEPAYSSGVRDVTLWFKNKTLDQWKAVPMTFTEGKWTAKLSNQSDTMIDFKITAFDRAGNSAERGIYHFQVKAQAGLPLSLILLIVLILAALIGSAAYLLWSRRQGRKGAEAMPPSKPTLPSPPPATPPAGKPGKPVKGYGMVSFVIPAQNEEDTVSQRIADAYERAAGHTGPSEIIVVDDGSMDNTYEAAWSAVESNGKKWPNIPAKVIRLSSTLGKEEAIQIGRNKATGEIVETLNDDTLAIPRR